MAKSICIEEMLRRECSDLARAGVDFGSIKIILDASAFKYDLEHQGLNFAYGKIVENQIKRRADIFPVYSIRRMLEMLKPEKFSGMASSSDEMEITLAATEYENGECRKPYHQSEMKRNRLVGDIGWADVQQISYAMRRARKGYKSIIISDDGDILGTVKQLRRKNQYINDNVRAISVRKYLEGVNKEFLRRHKGHYRRALFEEILLQHRHAA